MPITITPSTTQKDFVVANYDCTKNKHHQSSEKMIAIKSDIESPIPDISARNQLPSESQKISLTSNTGPKKHKPYLKQIKDSFTEAVCMLPIFQVSGLWEALVC